MKAIETEYKGYKFRSRLEARWAVFFDACGAQWEYEPEGFDLGDGIYYLPDFLLHDVWVRNAETCDLWVEVKGNMTEADAKKIIKFANERNTNLISLKLYENPILIVTNIPDGNDCFDLFDFASTAADKGIEPRPFNFEYVDGDFYAALPCLSPEGHFALVGADYSEDVDFNATVDAYRLSRQARFEHGERPRIYFKE